MLVRRSLSLLFACVSNKLIAMETVVLGKGGRTEG